MITKVTSTIKRTPRAKNPPAMQAKPKPKAPAKTSTKPKQKTPPRNNGNHPGGRPSDYHAEHCKRVIEWGKKGKSLMWIAAEFGVVKQTVLNWASAHPEFLDALTLAKQHAQAWWEDLGQKNMTTSGFAGGAYGRSMAARFPDDWREVTHQRVGDPDGKPLQNAAPALIQPVVNLILKK